MPEAAWVGIILSTLSLVVAYAALRLGGPRVRGEATLGSQWEGNPLKLHIQMWNKGRGAITVQELEIGLWVGCTLIRIPLAVDDPTLPVRLEGHSGQSWHISCGEYTERLRMIPLDAKLRVHVTLGNGKPKMFTVKTEDPEALLERQAQPTRDYTTRSDALWDKDLLLIARATSKAMPGQEIRAVMVNGGQTHAAEPGVHAPPQPSPRTPRRPPRQAANKRRNKR